MTKATKSQSSNLMENTYYKVRDDVSYQIKFYDITGAEITNFNGRKVRVLVPVGNETGYGAVLIGAANEEKIGLQSTPLVDKNGKVYASAELQDDTLYKFVVADLDNTNIPSQEDLEDVADSLPEDLVGEQPEDTITDEIPMDSEIEFEDDSEHTTNDISPSTGEGQRMFIALIFSLVASAAVLCLFRRKANT